MKRKEAQAQQAATILQPLSVKETPQLEAMSIAGF